jgi:hypothetical protein
MRYHMFVVLLKTLGVYLGVEGLGQIGYIATQAHLYTAYAGTVTPRTYPVVSLFSPAVHFVASLTLIFAAPVVARVCLEWKPTEQGFEG